MRNIWYTRAIFHVLWFTILKTILSFCLKQLQDILEVLVHAPSRRPHFVVLTLRMLQTPAYNNPKALLAWNNTNIPSWPLARDWMKQQWHRNQYVNIEPIKLTAVDNITQVHPLRIQKSTPNTSPVKMGSSIPRALTELAPTERRQNSPSYNQGSPKVGNEACAF